MFSSVATDVDRAVGCDCISREGAVPHSQSAVVKCDIEQIALGRFGSSVGAERHHAVSNDRQITVNQLVVTCHRRVFAYQDKVMPVGHSHAACGIDNLLEANVVIQNIGIRHAVLCGLIGCADIQLRVRRISLRGVRQRLAGEYGIGTAVGFIRSGRTCFHTVGQINIKRLRGFTVKGNLQATFNTCTFVSADRKIVFVKLGEHVGNDACGVNRIVKSDRTPPEKNTLTDRVFHVANACGNLHAFDVNQIIGRIGINIEGRVVNVAENLIKRRR